MEELKVTVTLEATMTIPRIPGGSAPDMREASNRLTAKISSDLLALSNHPGRQGNDVRLRVAVEVTAGSDRSKEPVPASHEVSQQEIVETLDSSRDRPLFAGDHGTLVLFESPG